MIAAIKLPAMATPVGAGTRNNMPGNDAPAESKVKAPRRGKISDLPPGTRSRYKQVMIPQLVENLGRSVNPWNFASMNAAAEVSRIWSLVFPNVEVGHDIDISSPIFLLVRRPTDVTGTTH